MINGIPVRIKTPNEKGDLVNVDTFYFATFRKCPALAKYPKEIRSLSNKAAIIARKTQLLKDRLSNASEDQLDSIQKSLDELSDQELETNGRIVDSFHAFVIEGLKSAGYDEASAEKYSEHIDIGRFSELFEKARTGAGACDFF